MSNINERKTIIDGINKAGLSGFHIKALLVSGLGFFTDAYDLFIIGVVISLLPLAGWTPLSTLENSILSSTTILFTIVGATLFGRLLDRLGRKRIYGVELVILIIGALGSAFLTPVNGLYQLIFWRALLGIGIGGDYAASSTIMAEYANTKNRGMLVASVFSMQSLGLVSGPALTLLLYTLNIPAATMWRVLLAIGAIPPLAVVYLRRRLPETPKFLLGVKGDAKSAAEALNSVTNAGIRVTSAEVPKVRAGVKELFSDRRLGLLLLEAAGAWFLLDWAFYGNSLLSSTILGFLAPAGISGIEKVMVSTEYSFFIFLLAAFPGYWLATFLLDRIGRRPIQLAGFTVMAASYAAIGLVPGILTRSALMQFMLLYGLSYFFIEFGPNVTTFILPTELFPVSVRGTGQGISAAAGKLGAFAGLILDPIIIEMFKESGFFIVLAALSAAGALLTFLLLPETKQVPLEETSHEELYLSATAKAS